MLDGNEHAAEIEPMHHQTGRGAVRNPGGARPFRPRDHDGDAEKHHHRADPQRQERERLGVAETQLGEHEARRPKQDENARRREHGEISQRSRHCLWARRLTSEARHVRACGCVVERGGQIAAMHGAQHAYRWRGAT